MRADFGRNGERNARLIEGTDFPEIASFRRFEKPNIFPFLDRLWEGFMGLVRLQRAVLRIAPCLTRN